MCACMCAGGVWGGGGIGMSGRAFCFLNENKKLTQIILLRSTQIPKPKSIKKISPQAGIKTTRSSSSVYSTTGDMDMLSLSNSLGM